MRVSRTWTSEVRGLIVTAIGLGLLAGCVSPMHPVTEPTASNLGFTVNAPGIEGWSYQEERSPTHWLLLYKWVDPNEEEHTQIVKLASDRLDEPAQPGELKEFVEGLLDQRRNQSPSSDRFTEREVTMVRRDVHGTEAYRARFLVEERDNPHFPGATLLMETVIYTFIHPADHSVLIQLAASERRPLSEERQSMVQLADSLVGSMQFVGP